MNIHAEHLIELCAFGYTEVEARFLYLVAAHSGYFTLRQFLDFAHCKSGKRNARLVEKLFQLGHASAQRYSRRSLVFQLHSRSIYAAIGKGHLRHRRDHQLGHIKTRLLALDFVLGHPQYLYFETAEEKRRYFVERFDVANTLFTPVREGGAGISFSDGFPMCMASPSPDSSPVVTFTYIDSEHQNLDAYIAHLRTYRPLFLVLPAFQFLYISTASSLQNEAALIFSLLVEGKGLSEMIRYFDLQTKWEREQYGRLTEADVLFLSEARKQFLGSSIDSLYYLWKRNRLPKDIHPEAARRIMPAQRKPFRAITVPGHEAVFGDSKRNWGDGWRFGGASRARSPRTALSAPHQVLQRIAHT